MTEKKLNLYTNLFFFFIFIPVLTLVVPTVKWVENRPWLFVAVIAYLIIIYQALTHANIPGLFIRHHYLRSMLYLMVALGVTALFARFAVWLSFNEHPGHPLRWTPIETTVWFLFLVILGFSFFNNMLMESARLARAREDMEAQRDKAELAMYKSQINPHFLFNTLNTLYGLILTDSDKREEAFEKFINMCKYTYNNANRDVIPMKEETEYLQEYVDLQQLRLGDTVRVTTSYDVDNPETPIAPMILITFLENAFKYGNSSNDDCRIDVKLRVHRGTLLFNVYNSHINTQKKVSSHNGIRNVRHRLDLLYTDDYTLRTHADHEGYHVRLEIKQMGRHKGMTPQPASH